MTRLATLLLVTLMLAGCGQVHLQRLDPANVTISSRLPEGDQGELRYSLESTIAVPGYAPLRFTALTEEVGENLLPPILTDVYAAGDQRVIVIGHVSYGGGMGLNVAYLVGVKEGGLYVFDTLRYTRNQFDVALKYDPKSVAAGLRIVAPGSYHNANEWKIEATGQSLGGEPLQDAFRTVGDLFAVVSGDRFVLTAKASDPGYGVPIEIQSWEECKNIKELQAIYDQAMGDSTSFPPPCIWLQIVWDLANITDRRLSQAPPSNGLERVVALLPEMKDDSVASEIVIVDYISVNGRAKFVKVWSAWRCHRGRGHQEYGKEQCV